MRKEITFDKIDAICDRFENYSFRCGNWWPTIEEIKENLEPKIEQNLEFLLWVASTADAPKTDEEKASKRYINTLVYSTLDKGNSSSNRE